MKLYQVWNLKDYNGFYWSNGAINLKFKQLFMKNYL